MWQLFVKVGGSRKKWRDACAVLLNMICITAASLGLDAPFGSLTLCMFRTSNSKKPKMRLKAAEGRLFLPILTTMIARFFSPVGDMEDIRLQCLQSLCRCYAHLVVGTTRL